MIDFLMYPFLSDSAKIAIMAALALTIADVVFGIANSIMANEFSSSKMREGIKHKSASFLLMLVGYVSDVLLNAGLTIGLQSPALVITCTYICVMEIGSLLETALKMNPDLASSAVFSFLKGNSDE